MLYVAQQRLEQEQHLLSNKVQCDNPGLEPLWFSVWWRSGPGERCSSSSAHALLFSVLC